MLSFFSSLCFSGTLIPLESVSPSSRVHRQQVALTLWAKRISISCLLLQEVGVSICICHQCNHPLSVSLSLCDIHNAVLLHRRDVRGVAIQRECIDLYFAHFCDVDRHQTCKKKGC
jgi:hypothetical protein